MTRHFEDADGLSDDSRDATSGYQLNHTMLRIQDPDQSLQFYTEVLGMTLVKRLDFPDMEFSLYFLTTLADDELDDWSTDDDRRMVQTFRRKGMLELTHNWGDEDDDSVDFHSGNDEPKGFGHIGIHVPDLDEACQRFDDLGVDFIKRPDEGNMQGLAFITDPDGYWVEVVDAESLPGAIDEHLQ